MDLNFLSSQDINTLNKYISTHRYSDAKSVIMDMKKKLHVAYAEIENMEKTYTIKNQLNLFEDE